MQFTPLISPMAALPPIALHAPTWTPEAHPTFPRRFGDAVRTVLMAHNRADNNLLSALPKELWVQAIFPMMGQDQHITRPHLPAEKFIPCGPGSGFQTRTRFYGQIFGHEGHIQHITASLAVSLPVPCVWV